MAKVSLLAWFFLRQKCVDYLSVLVGFEENGKAIFMKSPRGRPALPSQEAQEVKLSLCQTDDVPLIVANALCHQWIADGFWRCARTHECHNARAPGRNVMPTSGRRCSTPVFPVGL